MCDRSWTCTKIYVRNFSLHTQLLKLIRFCYISLFLFILLKRGIKKKNNLYTDIVDKEDCLIHRSLWKITWKTRIINVYT